MEKMNKTKVEWHPYPKEMPDMAGGISNKRHKLKQFDCLSRVTETV